MNAMVIDLKDFGQRTPEQVIRVFFSLYGAERPRQELWTIFKICAEAEQKQVSFGELDKAAIAALFDHLIALADALETLRAGTRERCVICGRAPAKTEAQ